MASNVTLLFVSADASGSVKVWHVPTMNCLSSTQEGSRQVLACAFNASASQYVTAGSDTTINLYDANTRQKLFSLEPRYVIMMVMMLVVIYDSMIMVICGRYVRSVLW